MEGLFWAPCAGAADRWFHFRLPNSTIARGFVRERLARGAGGAADRRQVIEGIWGYGEGKFPGERRD